MLAMLLFQINSFVASCNYCVIIAIITPMNWDSMVQFVLLAPIFKPPFVDLSIILPA